MHKFSFIPKFNLNHKFNAEEFFLNCKDGGARKWYAKTVSTQNGPIQNSPTQNNPEKYENERKKQSDTKKIRKTVPSNNCFNEPVGRELSFVQQT